MAKSKGNHEQLMTAYFMLALILSGNAGM